MRKIALIWVLVLVLMLVAAPASAGNNGNAHDKTWVCHHTGSASNPIILVHVNQGWTRGHGKGGPSEHQQYDEEATGYDGKAGPANKRGYDGTQCGSEGEGNGNT
ncbi:MAG: hypothetical protein M5U23_05450 [Acidimicrobiia bacterium]|nr:hypothetical protein [Acidimicrobiia bacterium]